MLFKARSYFLFGQLKSGKTHGVRERDALTTLCGLKTDKCPGEMLADDAGEVNCQVCIRVSTQQRRRPPPGEIAWEFRWYDGDEPRWDGYVDGEKLYSVHRLTWFCYDDHDASDACKSIEAGKAACLQHLRTSRRSQFFTRP
jgi:hypothetical protein